MYKRISVIIPVYNCEKYIETTVKSVLGQSYDIDIVLVNDGSKDSSPRICDFLARGNEKIHVIHQENAGVSVARNRGIDYVLQNNPNGYIAFLDADDGWVKNFFTQDIIDLLNGNYDLIGFQYSRCNSEMNRCSESVSMNEGEHSGGAMAIWLHASQVFAAMFYSCDLLRRESLRFIEGLNNNEDRIFTMQCMYLADGIFLKNKPLYLYRNNPNSSSHGFGSGISKYISMIDAYLELDRKMERFVDRRGAFNEGKAMAGIYVLDMVEEHFQSFSSKKELLEFFDSHEYIREMFDHPFLKKYRHGVQNRIEKINKSPKKFRYECYIKGIVRSCLATVYGVVYKTPLKKLIDKMRYPIEVE